MVEEKSDHAITSSRMMIYSNFDKTQPMLHVLLLLVVLFLSFALGQKPEHTASSLGRNFPTDVLFFPNSTSAVLYSIPERTLYVSHDNGRSWKREENMPVGFVDAVILHPFKSNIAFVITKPRDLTVGQTHYRTEDNGLNWTPFELPPSPAPLHRSLSFHSDPQKYGYIIYQADVCDSPNRERVCHGETYITTDAFKTPPRRILANSVQCQFAHSTEDFTPDVHADLIYCITADSRLVSSTDLFASDPTTEEPCARSGFIPSNTYTVFETTPHFVVLALETNGAIALCVSTDLKTWNKAALPVRFSKTQYALVPDAGHALAVDVLVHPAHALGTRFVSDAAGTAFAARLEHTNWHTAPRGARAGAAEAEAALGGVPGVGFATVVGNADDVLAGGFRVLRTVGTYDGGRSWAPLHGPGCDAGKECALHLHPRATPTHVRPGMRSPGVVVVVGSVGTALTPYTESDTFLTTDAGLTWTKLTSGAFLHAFNDAGSILVLVDNEGAFREVRYSSDLGETWETYDFGETVIAVDLIPIAGTASQEFLLIGERAPGTWADRYVVIHFNFTNMRKEKCTAADLEKWYAKAPGAKECFMGLKQPFERRKPHASCYMSGMPIGPLEPEGSCMCSDADYECDTYFTWNGQECVAAASEAIPPGACASQDDLYLGSSGYRKIPGNACAGGVEKEEQVEKSCNLETPTDIVHQTFQFPAKVAEHQYLEGSKTVLVLLVDHTLWQSQNEGFTWNQLFPETSFVQFILHKYDPSRAYLITQSAMFYFTTDSGRTWTPRSVPTPPNTFRAQILRFHPIADWLLWIGNRDCADFRACHAEAQYSLNNGVTWVFVENYVVNCAWAADAKLHADDTEILCESYRDKMGSQMLFGRENALALVEGSKYFTKKKKLFHEVIGFTKFSEFMVVAELASEMRTLNLQISLDGVHFAEAQFPPSMHPAGHAYTVLDSSTASLFIHMTMSEAPQPFWGHVLKSNSNGTYFGLSAENVNRNEQGYVDFEKILGLDGIALINIVSNSDEAILMGHKVLQSRITHNDGSTWKPLDPPSHDSLGNRYPCSTTHCALHLHGYTERADPQTGVSTSTVVGLIMAVGNVGDSLLPYTLSDTFLSRDGGFTWEEVHKDAHLWKVGDSGSLIVIANDEGPTDHVLFSTDEGLSWREYKFTSERISVRSISTVPDETSRRFLLLGHPAHASAWVAIHIDFTALTSKQCILNAQSPGTDDDFELWSPGNERAQRCLFGRQTVYTRRKRDADCYIGTLQKAHEQVEHDCTCVKADFECEFNYYKNTEDECVLAPGSSPLPGNQQCIGNDKFWYERTPYRRITYSSCVDGEQLDLGPQHPCPRRHSGFFWLITILLPLTFLSFGGYWYFRNTRFRQNAFGVWQKYWPWSQAQERSGYETIPIEEPRYNSYSD